MDPKIALPKRIQRLNGNVGSVKFKATEIAPICIGTIEHHFKCKTWGKVSRWKGILCDLGTTIRTGIPHSKANFESVFRGIV